MSSKRSLKILHVSPTYFSQGSVVGGGEKYISYLEKAIKLAAEAQHIFLTSKFLACVSGKCVIEQQDQRLIPGTAWDPRSVRLQDYIEEIKTANLVIVHQCLTAWGLLFAAQARRYGKTVFGYDHGAGEHPLIGHTAEIGGLFDVAISYSNFGLKAFSDLLCDKRLIRGPIDTSLFRFKQDVSRSPKSLKLLSVGRIMPHKGFERIIKAMPVSSSLTIIGSAYDENYLKYLRQCARNREVRFQDGLSDAEVNNAYIEADLYVHSSTHIDYQGRSWAKPELLGLAPLEALASGIPAFVSTAGSLPELAIVDGCMTYSDDAELACLLSDANKVLEEHSPTHTRDSVEKHFGCRNYGKQFIELALERL